jgi:cytochrome c peroxidase
MSARRARPAIVMCGTLLLLGATAGAVEPSELSYTFGVGAFAPDYVVPAVGSYELPPIQTVRDHVVLDEDGRETTLFDVVGERLAIVAFVYMTCVDAAGCPLSTAVLHRLDRTIADDPELRARASLVSLSFDPAHDTPSRMRERRALHEPRSRWRFLTTRDATMLDPLLADFGQSIAKLTAADGSETGLYRHVLKVFLLDPHHRVRNIYSAAYLHPDLILTDVRTLLATDHP